MPSAAAAARTRPLDFELKYTLLVLAVCLSVPGCVCAQNSTPGSQSEEQKPGAAVQKPAPVTTTIVVHGDVNGDYLPESVTVGTIDGEPLKDAPLSATVVTRDLLSDQVSRLLSDVVKTMPPSATITFRWVTTATTRFADFPSTWPRDSRSTA